MGTSSHGCAADGDKTACRCLLVSARRMAVTQTELGIQESGLEHGSHRILAESRTSIVIVRAESATPHARE
jgi:hypothetical protein